MAVAQEASRSGLGESLSVSTGPEDKDRVIRRLASRLEALEEACDVLSESFAVEAERSRALAAELERSQRQIVILTRALARIAGGDRAGALLESGMLGSRPTLAPQRPAGLEGPAPPERPAQLEGSGARSALALSGDHEDERKGERAPSSRAAGDGPGASSEPGEPVLPGLVDAPGPERPSGRPVEQPGGPRGLSPRLREAIARRIRGAFSGSAK